MHSHASLNRIYRLVWSAVHQTWVVASELAGGRGKSSSTPLLSAALLVSLASLSGGLWAAPQGGQVVAGSGSISANGATTTINQASDKLSINWQSFNVGKTESVNFLQPSATALAVNRIFDTQGTQILGRINANGQVWLINPNGVLFGKDAQINVGGLLASTLNPDDASIGSARSNFSGSSGTGTAGVVNFGQINAAQGGYVALLGHSVSNFGQISAPGGTVALGAGSAVSLNFAGSKLLGLEVTSNQVNALAENGGLIQADGGQVLLSAGARDSLLASVVNNTGVIQARTVQEQDGKIVLMGGMAAGTTNVAGTLDASAPNGGNGGFIETSAHSVKVDDSASISTASAQGTQGQWLIDPFDFYVAASGGNITGAALGTALGSNNVTIQTVETGNPNVTGATAEGTYTGTNGDIFVNNAVTWTSNKTLTLSAYRNITINSAITGTSGGLTLTAGRDNANQGTISAPAAVNLGTFNLTRGTWSQTGSLPSFAATSFQLTPNYSTFIRASSGAGTSGSPYQITDVYGLQGIGSSSTSRANHYRLANNVDASRTSTWNLISGTTYSGFAPIGHDGSNAFTGSFDGQAFTITGLTINRATTDNVGLFGYLNTAGIVQNVRLVNASVIGQDKVGGLVGFTQAGSISSSYATGSVSGRSDVGGLVGENNSGTISSSYAEVSVSGTNQVGGLLGSNPGTLTNSYATGSVSGSGTHVGGLVGSNTGTFSNSYATGSVSGSGTHLGGLVGSNTGTISSSFFDSGTTGKTDGVGSGSSTGVTGLATTDAFTQANYSGLDFSSTGTWFMVDGATRPFLRSEWSATVRNTHQLQLMAMSLGSNYTLANSLSLTADLASTNTSGMWKTSEGFSPIGSATTPFTGSFNGQNLTITGLAINRATTDNVGLFGYLGTGGVVQNARLVNASVIGQDNVGSLVGYKLAGSISNSNTTGSVSGRSDVGGLVGDNNSGNISSSYASSNVTGSSNVVGGLVGNYSGGTLSSSNATGGVSGANEVGGLVGNYSGGTLSSSYGTGSVGGTDNVGGLVGKSSGGTFSNSYASGSVSGTDNVGGLVGNASGGTFSSSYAAGSVSGRSDVGGLVGNASGGTHSTSYATGSVSGTNQVGGLVGSLGSSSSISTSYATGSVSGSGNNVGGLVGLRSGTNNITTSFFDSGSTGRGMSGGVGSGSSTGVTGLTTANAFTQANYSGLDFTNTWYMVDGATRPFLRSEWSITVRNSHQLQLMAMSLSSIYTLANTLNLTAELASTNTSGMWKTSDGFSPIGSATTPFTGSFDGKGLTITGLTINRATTDNVGLFGYLGTGGVVQNARLVNASVIGQDNVGSLVGYKLAGSISNSNTTGSVSGRSDVGGLVGDNNGGNITSSYATSSVTGSSNVVGGLVGNASGGTLSSSYATGSVSGANQVGGLVGSLGGSSSIVTGYATGNVSGSGSNVGGLVGNYSGGALSSSYAIGSVSGANQVGGLVGNYSGGTLSSSYGTGSVGGTDNVGGLVGKSSGGTFSSSYGTGSVSGTDNVGGLVGNSSGDTFSNSYATGSVSGRSDVGGLVGENNSGNISSSYAKGSVSGTDNIGGLVGNSIGGSHSNSYATGSASGTNNVGGLVGSLGSSSSIGTSYAAGSVTGSGNNVGGLVGLRSGTNNITTSFFDSGTTGKTNGVGSDSSTDATGLTTAAAFASGSSYSGWDFSSTGTWYMVDGATRPFLRSEWSTEVRNSHQLQLMAMSLGSSYTLTNSLNLTAELASTNTSGMWKSTEGFSPVGSATTPFTGSFNGQGNTITGLAINRATTDNVGLFGYLNTAGLVQNVGLVNASVIGQDNVGSLVGFAQAGSISNSYATGSISGRSDVGGLVGENNSGTISSSYATGSVSGSGTNVGGLVGSNPGTISNSYATGSVTGSGTHLGGLAGSNTGTISSSFFDSGTTGRSSGVGSGSSTGVTGLTTTNAFTQTNYSGLDFSSTWYMVDGATRPFLRSEWSTTVRNSHQLQLMAMSLSSSYSLANSLDLTADLANKSSMWKTTSGGFTSNYGFSPIGSSGSTTVYTGIFDGLGRSINGLVINRPDTDFVGLFGSMANGAVKNVGVTAAYVVGRTNVGALVGFNQSVTSNSYSTGSVSGSVSSIGGLVGGSGAAGTISNSYSAANVSGTGALIGGLVGINNGRVTDSYATGSVSGSGVVKGGLVGRNIASVAENGSTVASTISNSYATGAVSGSYGIGGLVGEVQRAERTVAGTLVVASGTVSNSYATGAVTATAGDAGGLAGYSSGNISSSYATGTVSGTSITGGLVGISSYGTISNSYATGAVSGVVAGGLVGRLDSSGTISSSYSTGSVTSTSYAGGLLGNLISGTVSNTYATGAVSGGSNRGGLVGHINASAGYLVSNSYATGAVTSSGATNAGGLVGLLASGSTGSITASYWNSDNTSSAGSGSAGTGLNTAAMKTASNFSAWSMSTVGGSSSTWFTYDGYTAPLLRSFLTPLSATYSVSGSKTYDGTTACATITCSYTTGTLTSGKNLFGTSSLAVSSKNAGSVTGAGLYSDQQGYEITASTNGTATITKAPLTITGSTASRTYTGVAQTFTGFTASGLLGSDTTSSLSGVSASASGTNVGSYTNSVTAGTQTNYTVTTENGTLTIAKAPLTITGNSASRTYSGVAQTLTGFTASGLLGSDTTSSLSGVSASGATGTNAGSYTNSVTAGTQTNYTVTTANGSLTIAKKALSVSGTSATGKTYNGNTTAAFTMGTLSGFVNSETVSASASGTFDSQNAGSRTATASYLLANGTNGGLASNYSLANTSHSATIAQKALTISGTSASGKTYDGNTTAAITMGTLSGFVNTETVTASANGTFDSQDAGSRTATASYTLANGTNGGLAANYSLANTTHSATIAKKALTITGNSASTTYTGVAQTLTGYTASGLVGTDTILSLSGIGASASGTNAGSYTNSVTAGTQTNYTVTTVDGTLAIAKAPLTITGRSASATYTGVARTITGYTVSGLVGTDTILSLSGVSASASGTNVGSYNNSVTAPVQTNYTVTAVDGALTIATPPLIILGSSAGTTYTISHNQYPDRLQADYRKRRIDSQQTRQRFILLRR